MQIHKVIGSDTLRSMFDALPTPIIVVDKEVMVQDYNAAAETFLLNGNLVGLTRRGHCVPDDSPAGEIPAGYLRNLFFRNHYIRYSVGEAFQGGRVVRRCTKLDVYQGGTRGALDTLVTCSPFQDGVNALMLLIIEVDTNTSEMPGLIRICSACHKVIDESETLARIETDAQKYLGVRFSHGLCPECFEKELAKINAITQEHSLEHRRLHGSATFSRISDFHSS